MKYSSNSNVIIYNIDKKTKCKYKLIVIFLTNCNISYSEVDNNKVFKIKITNTSSPNIHNKRQVFSKNSDNQNNMLESSKIRQIVSPVSNQRISNNPIKPSRSKRLYQIQSKAVEYYNSIMQNNNR